MFNDPLAEIDGVDGAEVALITVGDDVPVHVPLPEITVYEPEAVTVIDCVIWPFDQW